MIIKHIVELETVINEKSNESSAKLIMAMSDEQRQEFFQKAGENMLSNMLELANEGNSWAVLRIAKKASV